MATILIVEDESQVLLLAESYLQEHGYRTLSASTLPEAMAIIDSDEPLDVLFTDIGLGGDNEAGLRLAERARERRPDLKVLYTTGQIITDGMRALFVEGSAVLPKLYTVDQIIKSLADNFGIRSN